MYELRSACFIAFIILFFGSTNCQTVTLQGTSYSALIGSNITFTANSTTWISSSLIDWYFGNSKLTANGSLTSSATKYAVGYSNNNTLFTLTVISISSSDYGSYILAYNNLPTSYPTYTVTLSQLTTTTSKHNFFISV